ncbi:Retinol dehydrogenase 7, partial [Pseudolycoriella hygida]
MLFCGFFLISDSIVPYLSSISAYLLATVALWQLSHPITRKICKHLRFVPPVNKAVFITGCGSGFGHLLALRLNKMRFFVIASVRDTESDGAKALKASACNSSLLQIIKVDVTKDDDFIAAKKFVERTLIEQNLELHAVVNNAGVAITYPTEWYPNATAEDYRGNLDVNFLSIVRTCRTFLPLLRQSKGRIVNVISYLSRIGFESLSHYCASKHAAAGFTEAIVGELDQFGIRVVSVEPWFYLTPMVDRKRIRREFKQKFDALSTEVREAYGNYSLQFYVLLTEILTSWPLASNDLDAVIDSLAEAVRSPEPPLRIVVAPF